MGKITDLLDDLHDGNKSLEEVAAEFGSMKWKQGPPRAANYEEAITAELSDPPLPVEGSFDEVSMAYAVGQIDDKQYAVLAKAAGSKKEPGKPPK